MRKLNLKKETVAELTTDELGGVVGGTFPSKYDCTVSERISVCQTREACIVLPTRNACFTTHGCA